MKRKDKNLEAKQQTVEANNEIKQGGDSRVFVIAEQHINLS